MTGRIIVADPLSVALDPARSLAEPKGMLVFDLVSLS